MERMAQKMKKHRFTNNLGLKIIALFFSAFLWLIVVNVDNPIGSRTFPDIPVTIVNDDIIKSSGEVYQVLGEDTVSVVVYANREIRQKLKPEDIVATADISQMDTTTNLIPVTVSIPNYSSDDYESAVAVPRNLRIQREKSGSKVLALTADTGGINTRNGYTIGDVEVYPDNVTITGPESALDKIDRAVARVDEVDGISKDSDLNAQLVLYDSNGNELGQSQLENNLGEDGLTVSVEILREKTVPVEFSVSGTPAQGYRYTGCISKPESIRICGKNDDIRGVDTIRIPASVIDISGADAPVEQTVDIISYLPDGISLVDDNAGKIQVTAMVEQDGTRTISMLVSSARISNLADDLEVDYEPDAEITLRFSGEQNALDVLDISNAVSIDLSDYTEPGTYDVPVDVNTPDGISLIFDPTARLTLSEKAEETTETPETTENSGQESE